MKILKLKKLVAAAIAAVTIATLSPIGASAEWRQDSNGWWNTEGSSYSTGWRSIDSSWYYFGSDGYMKTGWANDNGTWYYMQPSGAMKTGWANDNGTWYYLQSSGAMKTGWINDNGTWYFTAASGAMETGVVQVDGKVYCLAPSGAMQTGNIVIDGVTYTFDASGAAVGDKLPTPTKAFAGTGVSVSMPSKGGTTTTGSTGSSSGGGGGSSSSGHHKTFQEYIDAQYGAQTLITVSDTTADVIKPTLKFTPGTENVKINGQDCVVKKDLYVTLNGKDVNVDGNLQAGYTFTGSGTVEMKASIAVFNTTTGTLYYATAKPTTFTVEQTNAPV